jgi:hydrogenase maturation protease
MAERGRTLVLGIGNLLLGDEGVGVYAARRLAGEPLADLRAGVEVLEGGTGGFHLLGCFTDVDDLILVDAALDDRPVGTVSVTAPQYPSDFPRTLTAHDIGLRDLVEAAALLGTLPRTHLVTVSVAAEQPLRTALSPAVEAALPEVETRVRELLARD